MARVGAVRLFSFLNWMRKLSSLIDQILVSGGNFLTIVICAHALTLSEQGKFTYAFASYMAMLLLNVSGIFQGAAVRAPTQEDSYKISLARLQLLQASLLSLLVCAAWFWMGNIFGWQATAKEAWLLLAFLIMQQLADFDRRAAYIFDSTKRAIFSSAMLYPVRIIGLIVIRPDTLCEVLMILIFSAVIPAISTLLIACRSNFTDAMPWVKAIKEHLEYSRLFIVGAPLGWLWTYIPIFLLGILYGREQAALLASIRSILNIANVLMEQLETKVVADWARTQHGHGAIAMEAAVYRLLNVGMVFWLLGMTTLVVIGREIVILVLGDLYEPHWNLLVIGWIGYGYYFNARVFGIKYRALGANHVEFIGNLCGVLVALIASFMLITTSNVTGAAWVYVIVQGTILISQILSLKIEKWREWIVK